MIRAKARKIKQKIEALSKSIFFDATKNAVKMMEKFPGSNISRKTIFDKYFTFDANAYKFNLTIEELVEMKKYCHILIAQDATLHIKKNVFFNNYCSVNCLDKIEIGENTLFGEGVKLYDHNHKFDNNEKLQVYRSEFTTAPIIIGKDCWIGSNVTILKGVTIGDNVIIGANCLIYKSIPSNSIVKNKQELLIQ